MNKLTDAKEYLEKALDIQHEHQTILLLTTMWLLIGQCLMEMNKLTDAKEYLEKALEIQQRTSNDLATDNTLHVMVNV